MGSLNTASGSKNTVIHGSSQVNWNEVMNALINSSDGREIKFTEETSRVTVEISSSKSPKVQESLDATEFHTPNMNIRRCPELSGSASTPLPTARNTPVESLQKSNDKVKGPVKKGVQFKTTSNNSIGGPRPPFRTHGANCSHPNRH